MLSPKRTKYRKYQKGRIVRSANNTIKLQYGIFGIQSLRKGRLTARAIHSTRIGITRAFRRSGKIFTRVFPDIQMTAKPAEVRMGKGKGSPSF